MTPRTISYSSLPEHMQGAFKKYIEEGISPGGFAEAILANDLVGAARRADYINCHFLFEYARWLSEECPLDAWGSYDIIERWIASHHRRIASEAGERGQKK